MSYEWNGYVHYTRAQAHLACASDWISANGWNGRDIILDILDRQTEEELTDQFEQSVDMDCIPWYSREAMLDAFRDIYQNPGKIFGCDVEDES